MYKMLQVYTCLLVRSPRCTCYCSHVLQSHGISKLRWNIRLRIANQILYCRFVCDRTCSVVAASVPANRAGSVCKRSLLPVPTELIQYTGWTVCGHDTVAILWAYIGWQWRNLVPYLCQLVFGAISSVKLWENGDRIVTIDAVTSLHRERTHVN